MRISDTELQPTEHSLRDSAMNTRAKPAMAPFNLDNFLGTSGQNRTIKDYRQDDPVFLQGDPSHAVFYIQTGRIRLTIKSMYGQEGVIAVLKAGAFLGEGCLGGQALNVSTAVAVTDARVLKIEKQTMSRMLSAEPALSELFISFLLARHIQLEADLAYHLFEPADER
jgi:CRP-like cAMP-binding protein